MLISIITINLNNKNGLINTIESVIHQSDNNIDFILIDGNSTDGSKDVIQKYKTHFNYFVSEPDTGIYNAMNKGVLNSKGDYILFLNSGDRLNNINVIKNIKPLLEDIDIVSGDLILEELNGKTHHLKSKNEVTLDFFFNISLYHQASFIKKDVFTKFGLHNETLKFAGDYEFFIRTLYKNNCTYKHVNLIISDFRTDGLSNNPNNLLKIQEEAKKSWLINVSERTYTSFSEYYNLMHSDEFYLKSRSPFYRFCTKLSKKLFGIRFYFYKKFKEKK